MNNAGSYNFCTGCLPVTVQSDIRFWGNGLGGFSYQIVSSTNHIVSYSATGLPTGLTLNTTTGLISGSTTAIGTYTVTLSAINNRFKVGYGTLLLTIVNGYFSVTFIKTTGGAGGTVNLTCEFSADGTSYATINTSSTYYIFKTGQIRTTLANAVSISGGGSSLVGTLTSHNANVTLQTGSTSSAVGTFSGVPAIINIAESPLTGGVLLNPPTGSSFNSTTLISGTVNSGNTGAIQHAISAPSGNATINTCQYVTTIDL